MQHVLWAHGAQTCIWTIYLSFREEFWCIYETFLPWSLPWWLSGKDSACQCRRCWRCRFKTGSRRSPGGGHGNLLSILAWRIPRTKEPGWLQSIESHRVRHNWSDLAAAAYSYVVKLRLHFNWHVHSEQSIFIDSLGLYEESWRAVFLKTVKLLLTQHYLVWNTTIFKVL